jgi:hypothetical protein
MNFITFVERVFRESKVAYRLDDHGGVHPFVDAAFTVELNELVRGFSDNDLDAARQHILDAEKALLPSDPDTRKAVRASFDAVENVFRLLFPECNRLNKHFVDRHLRPYVNSIYSTENYEISPMNEIVNSFIHWIAAGHPYRHEPGKAEITAPSMGFAIQFVSHGISYARWLGTVYKSRRHKDP